MSVFAVLKRAGLVSLCQREAREVLGFAEDVLGSGACLALFWQEFMF